MGWSFREAAQTQYSSISICPKGSIMFDPMSSLTCTSSGQFDLQKWPKLCTSIYLESVNSDMSCNMVPDFYQDIMNSCQTSCWTSGKNKKGLNSFTDPPVMLQTLFSFFVPLVRYAPFIPPGSSGQCWSGRAPSDPSVASCRPQVLVHEICILPTLQILPKSDVLWVRADSPFPRTLLTVFGKKQIAIPPLAPFPAGSGHRLPLVLNISPVSLASTEMSLQLVGWLVWSMTLVRLKKSMLVRFEAKQFKSSPL